MWQWCLGHGMKWEEPRAGSLGPLGINGAVCGGCQGPGFAGSRVYVGDSSWFLRHGPRPSLPGCSDLLTLWCLDGEVTVRIAVSRSAASFPWKLWELLLVCGRAFLPPSPSPTPSGHRTLTASRLPSPGLMPMATGYWLGPGKGALEERASVCCTSRGVQPKGWGGIPCCPQLPSMRCIFLFHHHRSTMLTMICQPGRGQIPWPSCPC